MIVEAAGQAPLHTLLRAVRTVVRRSSVFCDVTEAPTGALSAGWIGGVMHILTRPRTSVHGAAWAAGAVFSTAEDLAGFYML